MTPRTSLRVRTSACWSRAAPGRARSTCRRAATSSLISLNDGDGSELALGQVVSTGGNVTIISKGGLKAANPATTLVKGNRIELLADGAGADIHGSSLRIDSNFLGGGGLAARADGDIDIVEISGDLRLVLPTQFTSTGSVIAGGNVTLTALNGSILDAVIELPVLANSNPLTPQQQQLKDQLNGVIPISFTTSQVVYDATTATVGPDLVVDLGAAAALQTGDAVVYNLKSTIQYSARGSARSSTAPRPRSGAATWSSTSAAARCRPGTRWSTTSTPQAARRTPSAA